MQRPTIGLAVIVLLLTAPAFAAAYDCEYRRISLKDRTVATTLPYNGNPATSALVEKGMTGVVQFMKLDKGQWRYQMSWDGAMVLNRIHSPDGKHFDYYFPAAGIVETDVAKTETAEPSMSCRE